MNNAAPTHPSSFRLHPSPFPLRESLVRLNVCRERDFRRCRRRVRRLARGIPAFDFVWIDALLHAGILTPFQAKVLESFPPDRLRVGPCVLLDRLGRGEFSETYLARTADGLDKVVLKRLRPPTEMSRPALDRLRALIERLDGLDNSFLVGPHFTDQHASDLIVLSRHAAGPNCRELLVRRGRFPVDVVAQIARQLAAGLAAFESRACLHGQIQLQNVRLTAAGRAVLVDAGVGGALERGLLLRGDHSPETYEGTAPELIGSGNFKTTATELYAFGCLLWQLLAGRPPFPTGDPLGKLAAHQSRAVPEIQEFAPDTPAPLAEAVRALTQRDPSRRPATFAEVTTRFGNTNDAGHRRLARFRRQFDTAAPLKMMAVERDSRFSATAVLTLLLALSGTALLFFDGGAPSRLLRLRSAASSLLLSEAPPRADETRDAQRDERRQSNRPTAEGLRPLPAPDADGVVLLDAGPYEAETLSYVGDLSIRGTGGSASLIVIRDRPFQVVCRKFTMDHVILRREISATAAATVGASAGDASGSLLAVRSQEVFLERCVFVTDGPAIRAHIQRNEKPGRNRPAAVVWSGVDARDPDAGRIRLSNVLFFDAKAAVVCASPPGRLEADNCLVVGGVLFDLQEWPAARDVAISARHLTLRRAEALCRARISKTAGRKAQIRAALDECVFDLAGPQAGLLRLTSEGTRSGHDPRFVVTGGGSVIRPDVPIVAWTTPAAPGRTPEPSNAVVEGLAVGEFQFVGQAGLAARDSAVDGRSLQIPRRSDVPPGILAERLTCVLPPASAQVRAVKQHGPRPLAN